MVHMHHHCDLTMANTDVHILSIIAGRKASTYALFQTGYGLAPESAGGWPTDVVGPSTLPFGPANAQPRELNHGEIKEIQQAFVAATKRADVAGFDLLELHGAHGYLISSFLSPLANKRTDDYGGSFENRIRFLVETVQAVRPVWPAHKPLAVRITSDDFVAGGWTAAEAAQLSKRLQPLGVDIIDLSAGGNVDFFSPQSTLNPMTPGYQVPIAAAIKRAVPEVAVMAIGNIQNGTQAEGFLKAGSADLVGVARGWLANPFMAQAWAKELGVEINYPPQYNFALKWGKPAAAAAPKKA